MQIQNGNLLLSIKTTFSQNSIFADTHSHQSFQYNIKFDEVFLIIMYWCMHFQNNKKKHQT